MSKSVQDLPCRIPMLEGVHNLKDMEKLLKKASRNEDGDLVFIFRRPHPGRTQTGLASPGEARAFSRDGMVKFIGRNPETESEMVAWMLSSGDWDLVLEQDGPEGGTE